MSIVNARTDTITHPGLMLATDAGVRASGIRENMVGDMIRHQGRTMTDMISVGRIPLHPGLLDYNDAEGHVVLYVRDEEEGRSVYMSIEMYGEMTRAYEVRYDDFESVITRMMGEVTMANHDDPFAALLTGAGNAG